MLQAYVSSISDVLEVCYKFYIDVAKVGQGCGTCCKCFRGILQVFQKFVQNISSIPDICCKRSDLDVAYVSHICCNNMFQIFQLSRSYVVVSVFMLKIASVLSGCCICFPHILQMYILDVSYVAFKYFMLHVFHVIPRVNGRRE
jgi:NAD(P)H-nitrite reductase large subunit